MKNINWNIESVRGVIRFKVHPHPIKMHRAPVGIGNNGFFGVFWALSSFQMYIILDYVNH